MTRLVHAAAAVLVILAFATGLAFAQAKTYTPIRGEAEISVIVGKPVVDYKANTVTTTIKVKNTSAFGSIAGLKVEQYWWDKANSPQPAGGTNKRLQKPLQPGEEATLTLTLQYDTKFFRDSYQFSHANGKIKAKSVKAF